MPAAINSLPMSRRVPLVVKKMPTQQAQQSGIALVSVLVSVALIVGLVASLSYKQSINARRTGQILHTDQAIMYLFASEAFAKVLLNLDAQQNAYDYYSPKEPWGQGIQNNYDGGELESSLIELNGRFNVNNLYREASEEEINSGKKDVNLSSSWRSCYKKILESTSTDAAEDNITTMVDSIEDWIDSDVIGRSLGAEDNFYSSVSSLENSYKTGNNLIVDVRELALVRGYAQLFQKQEGKKKSAPPAVFRHITALPITNSKININTATEVVLTCLEPESRLTSEVADRIISRRESEPFTKISELYTLLDAEYPVEEETVDPTTQEKKVKKMLWNTLIPKNTISVSSSFFKMKSRLVFGLADVTAYSTMQRTPDSSVRIIKRVIDAL